MISGVEGAVGVGEASMVVVLARSKRMVGRMGCIVEVGEGDDRKCI